MASGDLSRRLGKRLYVLLHQFNHANPYIDSALSGDATFDLAISL